MARTTLTTFHFIRYLEQVVSALSLLKDFITKNLLSQSSEPACGSREELIVAVSRTLNTAVSECRGKFKHEVFMDSWCDHTVSVLVYCVCDTGHVSDPISMKFSQIFSLYKILDKFETGSSVVKTNS